MSLIPPLLIESNNSYHLLCACNFPVPITRLCCFIEHKGVWWLFLTFVLINIMVACDISDHLLLRKVFSLDFRSIKHFKHITLLWQFLSVAFKITVSGYFSVLFCFCIPLRSVTLSLPHYTNPSVTFPVTPFCVTSLACYNCPDVFISKLEDSNFDIIDI